MDAMLIALECTLVKRSNIHTALDVGIRALIGGTDLEFPSAQLAGALDSPNHELRRFAFDVLNKMCGGRLPESSLVSIGPGLVAAAQGLDGEEMPELYEDKVALAAEITSAISALDAEIAGECERINAAAAKRGRSSVSFVGVLQKLYL
jgi:hypothetical protein